MNGAQNELFSQQTSMPIITCAAMFVSLLFLDLVRLDFNLLPSHTLFGIVSTLLISVISSHKHPMLAWGLLTIPLFVILIGLSLQALDPVEATPVPASTYPSSGKFAPFSGKTKCSHRRSY